MTRNLIVYESKYGNTKLVAEKIEEGMKDTPGTEVVVSELTKVDTKQFAEFDAILVGSPNHIGSATSGVKKFIDNLGKLKLEGKTVAVFDTYMGKDDGKAMRKMEQKLGKKAPGLKLITPGLSIRIDGMKGPVSEDELPKCKEFGTNIARQIIVS